VWTQLSASRIDRNRRLASTATAGGVGVEQVVAPRRVDDPAPTGFVDLHRREHRRGAVGDEHVDQVFVVCRP
jgi:hypothetical protein